MKRGEGDEGEGDLDDLMRKRWEEGEIQAQEMERRGESVGRNLLKVEEEGQESEGKDQKEKRETRRCKYLRRIKKRS